MAGGACAWQGGMCVAGAMHGGDACMAGGCVWWGACMAGVCMAGTMRYGQ